MINDARLRIPPCLSVLLIVLLAATAALSQIQKPVLVVLNKAESTLNIIDPISMKSIGKVPTGSDPHEVVLSPDGKTAYVANYGAQTPGNTLSIIDVASAKQTRLVDLGPLRRPHGIQFIGGKLYFTSESSRTIARYDPTADKVDWVMGTGQNGSHMLVVSADQTRIYTANIGSDSVTMFELQGVAPANSQVTHIAVGRQPEAIDLSPDGKEIWTGLNAEGAIDIVDTGGKKQKEKVNTGGRPYRVRFTPDGRSVVCTMPATKELLVINPVTRKETGRLKLESIPLGLAFSKDGKTAFVTAVEPNVVLKIDLEKMVITGRVDPGNGPDGIDVFGL